MAQGDIHRFYTNLESWHYLPDYQYYMPMAAYGEQISTGGQIRDFHDPVGMIISAEGIEFYHDPLRIIRGSRWIARRDERGWFWETTS